MSSEVKKERVQMDPKYIITLTVTLLITCVVVAGLLGGVNAIPEGTEFSDALELTGDMTAAAEGAGATLDSVYEVLVGGENAGYAIKVVASGSQGSIEMMVGVDGEGAVTGVSIVSHSETSGIGTKVMGNEATASGVGVLDQFQGKSAADGTLAVGSNVDAITGATVSTRGVTTGVNAALAVAGAMG